MKRRAPYAAESRDLNNLWPFFPLFVFLAADVNFYNELQEP